MKESVVMLAVGEVVVNDGRCCDECIMKWLK